MSGFCTSLACCNALVEQQHCQQLASRGGCRSAYQITVDRHNFSLKKGSALVKVADGIIASLQELGKC